MVAKENDLSVSKLDKDLHERAEDMGNEGAGMRLPVCSHLGQCDPQVMKEQPQTHAYIAILKEVQINNV